ncbi:integrase catalytic domain-containing protein [Trichonephila inaurata madagascariensis]|uniref:Integrase catalytic domain-containing protein n=1 Tax=Trichonephila inaurata madagascariensis TaxID=2747483 RepID=A0A8X7C273_9ARAC|nr:integrase catalytic domain-containing protein [Trichonephila inaurata madagascariensis]
MDALKLRRTPLRTAFTKAVNHLQEIIENDPVDMNAVETAFEQLKVKSAKLKEVEDAVLELMIESNCTQEAYNIEFEAIEFYAEKMIAWQVRVKNIMKTDALGQKDNHSLVTSSSSSLRLPKIQFQQFSGDFNVLANQACPSEVLLQTLVVVLQNGNHRSSELESQPDNFETMVLGLIWNLKDDCLSCKINCQKNEGVDLTGPLYLKDKRKGWVVLFTCAVFRAVHFELITSLSTAAFLQSLRRFISRRGRPTIIYSDNGTNFVGSNSALNSINWDVVMSKANIQKIKWKFNPPSAAWDFGKE